MSKLTARVRTIMRLVRLVMVGALVLVPVLTGAYLSTLLTSGHVSETTWQACGVSWEQYLGDAHLREVCPAR